MSIEKSIKDILSKIEQIGISKEEEFILEDIRVHIYKEQLKRLVNAIDIFKKIEFKLNESIDEMDVKDLVNVEKALVKTIDNIQSLLRQFEPAMKKDIDVKDVIEELGLSETDNPKQILRKVIASQVVSLLNQVYEVQENLNKFKQGSLNSWKASESLKSLTSVITELIKTLERLEGDDLAEEGLTLESIINIYEEEKSRKN